MDAQERIRGAASGGFANEVSDHEESVATEAGYFIINLKLKQVMADSMLSPLEKYMAEHIVHHRP